MKRSERKPVVQAAIDEAGGMTQLASYLGITRGAVALWRDVPPQYVLRIEELTGISRHRLRPDVFGAADD